MSEEKVRTVLVVDDDDDFRWQQKVQLEAAGFKVLEAANQEDAQKALEATRPDIALVDLMMEEVDAGFTLCYHIKKKDPTIPVILISAVTSETGMEFDAATPEERSWVKADAMLA